jgi:peptidoglycan/xylan/chitin deacetylase (PgdA/CDA1 family)
MLKRVIKLLISLLFFAASSIADVIRRMMGRSPTRNAVVLYYHGIPSGQRANFARQLDMLLRWATPIAADLKSIPASGKRCAAVTFDDGLHSFAHNALPELEKRNITASLFVVAGKLGCYPDWSERVRTQTSDREPLLTAQDLRNLPGSIAIGSHTLTHPVLTRIPAALAMHELSESRLHLRKILGREITLFSFPHGDFDEELIESARAAGYERVFTIQPKLGYPEEFVIGRVSVDPADWRLEFLLKLCGSYRWLAPASTFLKSLKYGAGRLALRLQTDERVAK